MILDRLTPVNKIEIWQPRYKDRVALIAKFKVGTHNEVIFTKAKHMMDNSWYVSGSTVIKHPLETNGKIPCYAVPIDELEPFGRSSV